MKNSIKILEDMDFLFIIKLIIYIFYKLKWIIIKIIKIKKIKKDKKNKKIKM